MKEKEILRYLRLVDRRLTIVMSSGVNWKPEYEKELEDIDRELEPLRALVDKENIERKRSACAHQ